MTEIPENISSLNNEELKKKLNEAGISSGPLTPTTKKLYQRRLAQQLGTIIVVKNFADKLKEAAKDSKNENKSTSPNKLTNEEAISPKKNDGFYGILLPADQATSTETNVFTTREDALKFLTKNKGGRLKHFSTRSEAEQFCRTKTPETSRSSTTTEYENLEKVNEFKTPKQYELSQLMLAIEQNDFETFRKLVWSNPRFLINSGDGPVQLKPSARYNALHIAARSNRPEMVQEIISTLENPDFLSLMYPNTTHKNNERLSHILDLYFNTPEKGVYETPLHFASKLGFIDVVLELVSHEKCSISMKNKYDQTPFDVCCSRMKNISPETKILIQSLLNDQFYVPLLRCHDNSQLPVIGAPQTTPNTIPSKANQPHPMDPVIVVSALAGPMTSREASKIRQSWMTPDKRGMEGKRMLHIRRSDVDRGDERIGRELAKKAEVPWMEYWDFLQNYADFSTFAGLELLNNFLKSRYNQDYVSAIPTPTESKSVLDICSQLSELKVDDSAFVSSPKPNIAESYNIEASTPAHNSIGNPYFGSPPNIIDSNILEVPKTPREKRLDSVRGSLLRTRERQLSRVSEITNNSMLDNSHTTAFGSPVLQSKSRTFSRIQSSLKDGNNVGELSDTLNNVSLDANDSIFESPMEIGSTTSCILQSFLTGLQPTKLDRDVILAIGNTGVNQTKYPYIWKWMKAVLSYSEDDRSQWCTPKKSISQSSSLFNNIRKQPLPFVWPASPMAKTQNMSHIDMTNEPRISVNDPNTTK